MGFLVENLKKRGRSELKIEKRIEIE